MKKLLVLCVVIFISINLFAIETSSYVSTSQTGGRYEIIQSNIKRSLFLKLDKYSGDVFQYVLTSENRGTWQRIDILGKTNTTTATISFQLFLGGIAAADCILLDINSGDTYKLYEDTDTKELFFSKFE